MSATEFDAIIYDQTNQVWLGFKDPILTISTSDPSKVHSSLSNIETFCYEKELFAIGFLTYEAGQGMDQKNFTKSFDDYDLVRFKLYNGYAKFNNLPSADIPFSLSGWVPSIDRSQYEKSISSIKALIASGHTYQVNFTFRLYNTLIGDHYSLFHSLVNSLSPGYSAFLKYEDISICSFSPELFFTKNGSALKCKPMKGTIRRGRTLSEDNVLKSNLKNSVKDQAENIMIVDMTRNDLGRISKIGSVRTHHLFEIEKYPTLWQMTSTVESVSSENIASIFKALFPCSSITGAPKISTMKIIKDLESTPRGIYTGAIGFITPKLDCQFNVAIRTAVINNQTNLLTYGVGGGVVWDSTDQGEFEEALLKAEVITQPSPKFELKEAILWNSRDNYFLIEKHFERLAKSAELFDYSYDQPMISQELDQLVPLFDAEKHYKVNLRLSKEGKRTYKWIEICAETPETTKLKFSPNPVNSNDWQIYHKTTLQDPHLESIPNPLMADELFVNENGQITETSIANIAVELEGKLYTPPASCGLLSGTYREHLLETGQLYEKIIHKDELNPNSRIFLFNSVRKFWKATLVN